PLAPSMLDLPQEASEGLRVPGNSVVPVVAPELLCEGTLLIAEWLMAEMATPVVNAAQCPTEPVAGRLALDRPLPSPAGRPIVGETEQVERVRWDDPSTLRPSPGRRLEGNQPRLVGVQLKAILGKALRQHVEDPTS